MPDLVATAWTSAVRRHADGLAFRQPGADRRTRRSDRRCGLLRIRSDRRRPRRRARQHRLRSTARPHLNQQGLVHTEIELPGALVDSAWRARSLLRRSRDLLFEAAEALGPVYYQGRFTRTVPPTTDPRALAAPLREPRRAGRRTRHQDRHRDDAVLGHRDDPAGRRHRPPQPGTRLQVCSSTPGTCFARTHRCPKSTTSSRLSHIFGVELDDAAPGVVGTFVRGHR